MNDKSSGVSLARMHVTTCVTSKLQMNPVRLQQLCFVVVVVKSISSLVLKLDNLLTYSCKHHTFCSFKVSQYKFTNSHGP